MAPTAVLAVVAAILLFAGYRLLPTIRSAFFTPLRHLPGPPSPSLFWGNFKLIAEADNSVPQEEWAAKYGPTIAYNGIFGMWRLWSLDTRVNSHILARTDIYQRPSTARYHLTRLLGPGVLVTEDEQHKNQRRAMNPAFGPHQLREITDIFVQKSNQLRDLLSAEIAKADGSSAKVDALSWLGRATLDIIGLAGFNYNFDALNPSGQVNELSQAFSVLFSPAAGGRFFTLLQGFIPPLRLIRTENNRREEEAMASMSRIGRQLIAEKKAAILAESQGKGRGVSRKDVSGRDLLTLLIKANMATDIPESQRLTDDEVLAQVPTFIVAGHETTSSATTWCLFQLTQSPDVQRQLREELLQVPTDTPTMDELSALPYLDMVVKETLRHHAPVAATTRVAMQDDVIPVNTPFVDRKGRHCDHIRIAKGDLVFLPILAINRSKELWGDDALEFNPARWEHPCEAAASIPGVWANQLTFLGGPRACIGYRFSVVETKALLFALVRAFEFELAVRPEQIKKKSSIVQRPVVTLGGDKKDDKVEMPLLIRPYRPA